MSHSIKEKRSEEKLLSQQSNMSERKHYSQDVAGPLSPSMLSRS